MKILSRICAGLTVRQGVAASRGRLYRVALAWTGGDAMLADDLVQETLALGLQRAHQLREPERLGAWLFSILRNCWLRHLRTRPAADALDPETLAGAVDVVHQVEQANIATLVRQAICRLPTAQREVVALVDLEGLSYAEVAAVLDIPIGTVMSRLSRARKALLHSLRRLQSVEADSHTPRLRRVQ